MKNILPSELMKIKLNVNYKAMFFLAYLLSLFTDSFQMHECYRIFYLGKVVGML